MDDSICRYRDAVPCEPYVLSGSPPAPRVGEAANGRSVLREVPASPGGRRVARAARRYFV